MERVEACLKAIGKSQLLPSFRDPVIQAPLTDAELEKRGLVQWALRQKFLRLLANPGVALPAFQVRHLASFEDSNVSTFP